MQDVLPSTPKIVLASAVGCFGGTEYWVGLNFRLAMPILFITLLVKHRYSKDMPMEHLDLIPPSQFVEQDNDAISQCKIRSKDQYIKVVSL